MKDDRRKDGQSPPHPPAWYEEAIFYELSVRSFYDASGDGIGDFAGLTQKLDHIQDLGATCLWLLPFFASPWRDDGYDVTNYRAIHPAYGSMDDFQEFIAAAHDRGLRVAAEMAINHTSIDHPWFQAARAAPPDSPLRAFYVWSDSAARFAEAEILHVDSKRSNWTWDEQARAFYWHRFYKYQPDLNFLSPEVREEVAQILRFWAELGLDGLCLNGAAYLVERDGTACEHLPETHNFLKDLRQRLQGDFPELMIQAGVNAVPQLACTYFGASDECHMAPHLAIPQRLFQSLRQEDRQAIEDTLVQTPAPPAGCQWVMLLRNHDEMTLKLATDEVQDFLLREYAADPATRLHAGILRRLAPLVDNSRPQMELLFGLLLALPGAPMIYYGDEIGMGDNVFLAGRGAVRTPMQWTPDRNGGFSQADFARLPRPPVMDSIYGFLALNVESQRRNPGSLYHWLRRLIALRKRHTALATGSLQLVPVENGKILAFVRAGSEQTILVVANLARTAQPVELPLAEFSGLVPVEMFGRTAFRRIGNEPYQLNLGPHSFYWFRLQAEAEQPPQRLAAVALAQAASAAELPCSGAAEELLDDPAVRAALVRDVLPRFLPAQRWFGGKARTIERIELRDWGLLPGPRDPAFVVLAEVAFRESDAVQLFCVPLAVATGARAAELLEAQPKAVLARLTSSTSPGVLFDALADAEVCRAWLELVGQQGRLALQHGVVRAAATTAYEQLRGSHDDPLPVVLGPATSSNSLVFFGRRLLLKVFRRLQAGINPDFEIGKFLTETHEGALIPRVAGMLEYRPQAAGETYTLGILQALVKNQGDGWQHALDELGRYYERASARMLGRELPPLDSRTLGALANTTPPPAAIETIGSYLYAAAVLGRRTAEMHLALAADTDDADFAPELLSAADMQGLRDDIQAQGREALAALAANVARIPAASAAAAQALLDRGAAAIDQALDRWRDAPAATKTRIHGDYHLGQVLWNGHDYVILDFEGEPVRTVEERRAKFSPIRDVAGMLRSYHYAAYAALFAYSQDRPADLPRLADWAEVWQQWTAATFLQQYTAAAAGASFLPSSRDDFSRLLEGYMLGKALYELVYELNNRPDWVRIPLGGVMQLLNLNP